MNMKAPIAALLVTLLAVSVAPTPARAQTELERLGGGPGGVPQQNPRFGFFNERAGNKLRTRSKRATAPSTAPASPSPAAEEEAAQEPPDIEWKGGLISVSCDDTHIGDFLLEFNRQTGISVHLEPGIDQRVSADFKNLRLERALPMLFPEGTWELVRKPNTALRAEGGIAGLVVHPPSATCAQGGAKAKVGGMNFGPAFDIPGSPATAATPASGDIPVEMGDASVAPPHLSIDGVTRTAPSASPSASPSAETRVGSAASAQPASPEPGSEDARRRIADLLDEKQKKKK